MLEGLIINNIFQSILLYFVSLSISLPIVQVRRSAPQNKHWPNQNKTIYSRSFFRCRMNANIVDQDSIEYNIIWKTAQDSLPRPFIL